MRTSSLTTTILHENGHVNETVSDMNDDSQIEQDFAPASPDNLLFTTASKAPSKSSYWAVTDRQPEWYKLSIPINQPISNQIVPYKKLSKTFERRKSNSNNNEKIDRPTYVIQIRRKYLLIFHIYFSLLQRFRYQF
jgi:hypothetical protein